GREYTPLRELDALCPQLQRDRAWDERLHAEGLRDLERGIHECERALAVAWRAAGEAHPRVVRLRPCNVRPRPHARVRGDRVLEVACTLVPPLHRCGE